jgi:hypothetical protein
MLLNLLYKCGIKEIWLAGVDGFDSKAINFIDPLFNNRTTSQNIVAVHSDMEAKLLEVSKVMKLHFVTASIYEKALREGE